MYNNLFFRRSDRIIFWLALLLGLLTLAYLARGFYVLTLHSGGAKDLYYRWKEQLYIYRGVFPYIATGNSPLVDPDLGPIRSSGYLPWSFFAGFVLLPPIPFALLRWYHALLNLISIAVLAVFAYQIGRPFGKLQAGLAIAACLALGNTSNALGNGQYVMIINAFLIGMYWLLQKKHSALAGLFLGVALLKPTISMFYFFVLLARRKFAAAATCCLYLLATSCIIGLLVKVSPIAMISNVVGVSAYYAGNGYSNVNVLLHLGIPPLVAVLLSLLIFSTVTFVLFNWFKNHSLLFLFAIAALMGRLATYHLLYDNVMLVFLALALMQLALKIPSKSNILLLGLLLLSLLVPGRLASSAVAQGMQTLIWLATFFYLLIQQKHFKISRCSDQKTVPVCL